MGLANIVIPGTFGFEGAYPQDLLILNSQEIKKNECEKDGVVEWMWRENKMESCIMFFILLKRSSTNAYISEEYEDQCTFYVLIFVNINLPFNLFSS